MYVKDYHHDYLVHQKEVDLSQWKLRLCFWSWYLSKFTFPTIIFKSSRSNDQVAAGKFHRSTLILQFYLFSTFKKTFVTQYRAPESKEPQYPWVKCAYLGKRGISYNLGPLYSTSLYKVTKRLMADTMNAQHSQNVSTSQYVHEVLGLPYTHFFIS